MKGGVNLSAETAEASSEDQAASLAQGQIVVSGPHGETQAAQESSAVREKDRRDEMNGPRESLIRAVLGRRLSRLAVRRRPEASAPTMGAAGCPRSPCLTQASVLNRLQRPRDAAVTLKRLVPSDLRCGVANGVNLTVQRKQGPFATSPLTPRSET